MLSIEGVAGPTTTDHHDGTLFDAEGNPLYCQIMLMHWNVSEVVDETVAEIHQFLKHPVHLFSECQAVNAIENNVHGRLLTPHGFVIGAKPAGDAYYDKDVVMITSAGSGVGTQDLWMTGFVEGACPMGNTEVRGMDESVPACQTSYGKVSYLGGHRYDTKLPISKNPTSQGTRLFLNSLFEAQCATAEGQPYVWLKAVGPDAVSSPQATWTLTAANLGPGTALDAVVLDPLPGGATLVAATGNYTLDEESNTVRWSLGNLGVGDTATVDVTVRLAGPDLFLNQGEMRYVVGVNEKAVLSEVVTTAYSEDSDGDGCLDAIELEMGTDPGIPDSDGDGTADCSDTCPTVPNPLQDLSIDPTHCGNCETACSADHAILACEGGDCVVTACDAGWLFVAGAAVPCVQEGSDPAGNDAGEEGTAGSGDLPDAMEEVPVAGDDVTGSGEIEGDTSFPPDEGGLSDVSGGTDAADLSDAPPLADEPPATEDVASPGDLAAADATDPDDGSFVHPDGVSSDFSTTPVKGPGASGGCTSSPSRPAGTAILLLVGLLVLLRVPRTGRSSPMHRPASRFVR